MKLKHAILCLSLALCLGACASSKGAKGSKKKPVPSPAEKMAIKHYKMGIDAYANSRYSEAIRHWKVTLDKDPENPNAADYIERAEKMLQTIKAPTAK